MLFYPVLQTNPTSQEELTDQRSHIFTQSIVMTYGGSNYPAEAFARLIMALPFNTKAKQDNGQGLLFYSTDDAIKLGRGE